MDRTGSHLILYDGVCGLCNGLVRFVVARDPDGVFHFAALGSDASNAMLRRFHRDPEKRDTFYVVSDYQSETPVLYIKARAALFLAREIGGLWRLAAPLGILPNLLLNAVYDVVARYRYRIFGKYDVCPAPPPGHESRFIDR